MRAYLATLFWGWIGIILGLALASPVAAAPPWNPLAPFQKSTAAPTKIPTLTDKHGPWLIMATSFSGPNAEQQATELAQELRQSFRWTTYLHKFTFDYSKPVSGLGVDKYGDPKRFRHLNGEKYDEIAVMIGDYSSVEDPTAQRSLDAVKHARPACLDVEKNKQLDQTFAQLRHFQRKLQQTLVKDQERKTRGPMGHAFLTRNPLLPEEMFVSKGLDPFVVEMNQDLEFSLLKNPKRYTVRVASFRGVDTMNPAKFEELTNKKRSLSKIDEAAQNAHKLVEHLRKKGVEAYEFHDVTESIVCVGGFDDVGQPRADGRMEINPAIHRVLQQYGPSNPTGGISKTGALQPRIEAGLPLDYQPLPVEVPRASIGSQYAKTAMRK